MALDEIALPARSVEVVICNCVIDLSVDVPTPPVLPAHDAGAPMTVAPAAVLLSSRVGAPLGAGIRGAAHRAAPNFYAA